MKSVLTDDFFRKLTEIACNAGNIIRNADRSQLSVNIKPGDRNFVTDYDIKVQGMLRSSLTALLPQAGFLGEEDNASLFPQKQNLVFIVDPIDGTSNFMSGLNLSAVSIALCMPEEGRTLAACIHCPYRNETFFASEGSGAFRCAGFDTDRKEQLHVTPLPIEDCINAFGSTPYDRTVKPIHFTILDRLFSHSVDVRNLGTAALHCAYVSAGIFGAYYENRLSVWDYAAGMLLITEAGGIITNFEGNTPSLLHPDSIVAGSPANHAVLLHLIQEALK